MEFIKPIVVISKCLEFDACRYDGQLIPNRYIKELKKIIDFKPVCPEVEIDLGVPRDTIKIVENKGKKILYQPETGTDFASKMDNFSKSYIRSIINVDGFILKSKSPSCGIKSAKIYSKKESSPVLRKGNGFFADEVIKSYPDHPAEEETRLNNVFLREHFYTSIFTIADYRSVKSHKDLYNFHAKHKYLFMSYNQTMMTKMGRIAANMDGHDLKKVFKDYYYALLNLFKKRARYTSNINTLMHIMGYFKHELSSNEKTHLLETVDLYRKQKIPLSSPSSILDSWVRRFNNEYLIKQSFFNPFPKELIESNVSRFN